MYHGSIDIRLVGSDAAFALLEQASPVGPFEHQVSRCNLQQLDVAGADLVVVSLTNSEDVAEFTRALEGRPCGGELIVLAPAELVPSLLPLEDQLTDIWIAPLAEEEAAFRFRRWQERFKERADAWETSQFLEATINSIPCLVWYKTKDGIHEKVNDSFCLTVNKPKDDVQGRGHAYIWDVEQDDPACIESEEKVMSTQQTCVSEEVVQSGEDTRLLTTYKSPLYNPDGTVMGTVGVAIDITQERAYERDLIEKNQTLETIFTSMECGVLTHSIDGSRVLGVNQAALRILGYETVEEMLEDGFDMFATSVFEEDALKIRERLKSITNVGDSISTEYRVRHDDGKVIHVMGNIKLIEKDGELLYQRFLLDNSEQKQVEEMRKRRQQALVQALSADYTAVFAFDLDSDTGEPLRRSHRFPGTFQEPVSLERTLGGYIDDCVFVEDRSGLAPLRTTAGILKELEGRDRFHLLYRAHEGDGLKYCQSTVVKAGDWDEDQRFVVVGFRNVDAETREELNQKEMLKEALAQARHASEAKSLFLSNMSHDIRTPMNAIVGFTSLATSHIDNTDQVREYLGKIHASSAHLLSLINDILDMSRIESGKIALEARPCKMSDIMDDLASIMEPEAEAKGLSLSFDTAGIQDATVMADRLKIDQVFLNLLGNAVKFTEPGGKVRLIARERPDAPEGRIAYQFLVQDNGIGMTSEFIHHIFDPFERERTSTVSGIQGTGLGMAITKSLIDMMEGVIEVRSEKGVGSEFDICLTFPCCSEETAASGQGALEAGAAALESFQGCKVLLVDDNLLNREIAITLLEDAGFEVDYAVDGQGAVDKMAAADRDAYQLVLMDIQMPVMNGYDATRAIRAMDDPVLSQIPILAVTADAFEEDRKRALECGMNGHLPKPIQVTELFDALEHMLR